MCGWIDSPLGRIRFFFQVSTDPDGEETDGDFVDAGGGVFYVQCDISGAMMPFSLFSYYCIVYTTFVEIDQIIDLTLVLAVVILMFFSRCLSCFSRCCLFRYCFDLTVELDRRLICLTRAVVVVVW